MNNTGVEISVIFIEVHIKRTVAVFEAMWMKMIVYPFGDQIVVAIGCRICASIKIDGGASWMNVGSLMIFFP